LKSFLSDQGSHASWKVLVFSWKFQDLESHGKSLWSWKVLGKISLKVMHFLVIQMENKQQ